MSNNPIGTSIYKLSKIIHKSGIIELDLSNTDIGDKGSEAISLSLEANFGKYPTLCRLNLSSNGI